MELGQSRIRNISNLVGSLRLTPRQIQEVFRILGHLFEIPEDRKGKLRWCIAVGSIAMAALKFGESSVFESLGAGSLEPEDAVKFLRQTVCGYEIEWWFKIFLTGRGMNVREDETAEAIMKRVGLIEPDRVVDLHGLLAEFQSGCGDFRAVGFPEIQQKIQQISQWT
jgi:hypothetical protein